MNLVVLLVKLDPLLTHILYRHTDDSWTLLELFVLFERLFFVFYCTIIDQLLESLIRISTALSKHATTWNRGARFLNYRFDYDFGSFLASSLAVPWH